MKTELWLLRHPYARVLFFVGFFFVMLLIGWYIGEYNPHVEGWM